MGKRAKPQKARRHHRRWVGEADGEAGRQRAKRAILRAHGADEAAALALQGRASAVTADAAAVDVEQVGLSPR